MVTLGDNMVDPIKPQGYRKKEDMLTNSIDHEQEIIESVSEAIEAKIEYDMNNKANSRRSFFSTVVTCTPYVIMGLGSYMIFQRIRKLFKPKSDGKRSAEG